MVMTQVQEQSKLEPSIKPFFLEHTRELYHCIDRRSHQLNLCAHDMCYYANHVPMYIYSKSNKHISISMLLKVRFQLNLCQALMFVQCKRKRDMNRRYGKKYIEL